MLSNLIIAMTTASNTNIKISKSVCVQHRKQIWFGRGFRPLYLFQINVFHRINFSVSEQQCFGFRYYNPALWLASGFESETLCMKLLNARICRQWVRDKRASSTCCHNVFVSESSEHRLPVVTMLEIVISRLLG